MTLCPLSSESSGSYGEESQEVDNTHRLHSQCSFFCGNLSTTYCVPSQTGERLLLCAISEVPVLERLSTEQQIGKNMRQDTYIIGSLISKTPQL